MQVLYIDVGEGLTNQSLRKNIQVGSTAITRLHDGREVEAKITKIVELLVARFTSSSERSR